MSKVIERESDFSKETEKFSLRPEAKIFLSNLSINLRWNVETDFVNYLDTGRVDRKLGCNVRAYCLKGSKILQFPNESWQITETIYSNDKMDNFFDNYIVSCKSGRATASRFSTVVEKIPGLIKEKNATNIWSLGSGIGSDLFQVLMNHPDLEPPQIVCFEMDESACLAGKILAGRGRMGDNFKFVGGDFRKTAIRLNRVNGGPDLALMIGVICPMEPKYSTRLLKLLRSGFKPGTTLVVSTVMDQMFYDDPFSCYLVHLVMDWKLFFVSSFQFRQMLETAGYIWQSFFTDEFGYHGLAVCQVP